MRRDDANAESVNITVAILAACWARARRKFYDLHVQLLF